jgi:hypothetical protein
MVRRQSALASGVVAFGIALAAVIAPGILLAQTPSRGPQPAPPEGTTAPRSTLPPANRAIAPRSQTDAPGRRPENPQAVKPDMPQGIVPERPPKDENSNQ